MDRVSEIRRRLADALHPTALEVVDDSHLHAGHAGAAQHGGGHFRVRVASAAFRGLPTLARHKLVYEALKDMMSGEIHALSIEARDD